MQEDTSGASKPMFNLGDIYYVLFKHKWKVLSFSAAGVLAALALFRFWPVVYKSEAELFIKYVREVRSDPGLGENARITSPDQRGETIINNERQILTSLNVAKAVAAALPPEIAAKLSGEASPLAAAAAIHDGLTAEVLTRSSVIQIVFQHSDPDVVQPVLNLIVEQYLKKHAEIHRPLGLFDSFLTQETDQLRSRLVATEKQLRGLKSDAGVLSVEAAMQAYAEQITMVRQQIFEAETELAVLDQAGWTDPAAAPGTNAGPSGVERQPDGNLPEATAETVAEYLKINGLLDNFRRQEQTNLINHHTPEHPLVKAVRAQIKEYEDQKAALEKTHPALALRRPEPNTLGPAGGTPFDPVAEAARVRNLRSRVRVLKEHMDKIYSEASVLSEKAPTIADLQRQIQIQEARYRAAAGSLEQARMEEALGPDRIFNISIVQNPTPPTKVAGKLRKMIMGVVAGGLAAGLALAFLIEFYLDQSVKRPIEVETRLGLPLLLAIPEVRHGKNRATGIRKALPSPGDHDATPGTPVGTDIAPWALNHGLRTYLEALRDRLVFYFDIRNLTHKPKLVAVTGCGEGSGVSTIAAGLAAGLSQTGDGNVLLVDMNMGCQQPYHFHRGDLQYGLDELLEGGNRESALVQDHLYVVSHATGEDKLERIMPKRFNHLVPKLKASDYDYIIFDMPAVSQLSVTPQLARYMDMVLLVVESEKTSREVVKRASHLLAESKANVSVVLNKTRNYVPRRLQQEI